MYHSPILQVPHLCRILLSIFKMLDTPVNYTYQACTGSGIQYISNMDTSSKMLNIIIGHSSRRCKFLTTVEFTSHNKNYFPACFSKKTKVTIYIQLRNGHTIQKNYGACFRVSCSGTKLQGFDFKF